MPTSKRQQQLSEGEPPSPSQKKPPSLAAAKARRKAAGTARQANAGATKTKTRQKQKLRVDRPRQQEPRTSLPRGDVVTDPEGQYGLQPEQLELLQRKMKAGSCRMGGQDPRHLLDRTDSDGGGLLDMEEFRRAIRNVGQLTAADLSDNDVRCLFRKIDRDNSGAIDLNELSGLVWGTWQAPEPEPEPELVREVEAPEPSEQPEPQPEPNPEVKKLQHEIARSRAWNDKLVTTNRGLSQQLADARGRIAQADTELEALRSQLVPSQVNGTDVQRTIADKTIALDNELSAAQQENVRLWEQNASLREQNANLSGQLAAAQEFTQEKGRLHSELVKAQQHAKTLRKEKQALRRGLATKSTAAAAADLEDLRSANDELCGLLICRDHTIAELTEDNARLNGQCTQLVTDRSADQSLMSALESRTLQAEERCNSLRMETDQLRQKMLVNQRIIAVSARKLQLSNVLRSFNAWTAMVEHAVSFRRLGTKVIKRVRTFALAAALSNWREATAIRIATKRLLVKCVHRIRNMTLAGAMLQWHESVKQSTHIRTKTHQTVRVWCNRALARIFRGWLLWYDNIVAARNLCTKVVKRLQSLALTMALTSWREATAERVATKQISLKVVQRIRNNALSTTFDRWALWQEAQVRDREMQKLSAEQEARVRKLTASQRKVEKQKMRLVVQKLRLRTLARVMAGWRSHVMHMQVIVANSKLIEGLNEAQGALVTGLSEAEAEIQSTSAMLRSENVELENALADAFVENESFTARCTELVTTQERLESTTAELEERAAAAEISSAALAAEINSIQDANIELDRAVKEATQQIASLKAENIELAELNNGLESSATEAKKRLAVVSKEMNRMRDELAMSRTKQEEMQTAVNKVNNELDASLARERIASDETMKLRGEVMMIADLLKERSIHVESARLS